MDVSLFIILINTSLFILTWKIQLIVYPGFLYYREQELKTWHPIYAKRIGLLVFPLMFSQLLVYGYGAMVNMNLLSITMISFVVFTWAITIMKAIPLHTTIDEKQDSLVERKKLIRVHAYRTVIWTLIFIISLIDYVQ